MDPSTSLAIARPRGTPADFESTSGGARTKASTPCRTRTKTRGVRRNVRWRGSARTSAVCCEDSWNRLQSWLAPLFNGPDAGEPGALLGAVGSMTASVFAGVSLNEISFQRNVEGAGFTKTFDARDVFGVQAQLNEQGQITEFGLGLRIWGSTGGGSFIGNFFNTMELQSITFPDGSTPEEHGLQLVLGSGLESPNLNSTSPVPEPSTFALLGIGSVCLTLARVRRRRRTKVA